MSHDDRPISLVDDEYILGSSVSDFTYYSTSSCHFDTIKSPNVMINTSEELGGLVCCQQIGSHILDNGKAPCYIIRLSELEVTKKMLAGEHSQVQPDLNAIRRRYRHAFERSHRKNQAGGSLDIWRADLDQPSALVAHRANCGRPIRGDEVDMRFDCGHYKCSECIPSCSRCQDRDEEAKPEKVTDTANEQLPVEGASAILYEFAKPAIGEMKMSETNPPTVTEGYAI